MSDINLVAVCGIAFVAVFLLLSVLAVLMNVITAVFPAKIRKLDAAVTAAISAAVAVAYPGMDDAMVEVEEATVSFRELTEDEIDWYAGTGEGVGKAGGYAVQGLGGTLVETLDGDRETVIGLPTSRLSRMLEGS